MMLSSPSVLHPGCKRKCGQVVCFCSCEVCRPEMEVPLQFEVRLKERMEKWGRAPLSRFEMLIMVFAFLLGVTLVALRP
jgi:hypothetical protein